MPRVLFYTASTLNGFLADDADSLDWLFAVPDGEAPGNGFDDFLAGIGALVMGSATYEWVLEHEDLLTHPEKWAGYYGERPCFVFTSRPDLPRVSGTPIHVVAGPVAEHWEAIATAAGGQDVWVVGGGDLVGQFDDAGHLDELIITIAPATLPAGKPLLPRRIGSDRLHLVRLRQVGEFAELTYAVTR